MLISIIKCFIVVAFIFFLLLSSNFGHPSMTMSGISFFEIDLIYLVIFIFILIFFFTYKLWNEIIRKTIKNCIIIYCCFNLLLIFSNFGVVCVKRSRASGREKACWSNIRVIQGAVELYNEDYSIKMEKMDIPSLIKNGYLKEEPTKPEEKCCYFSFGDLSKDGFIFCSNHLVPGLNSDTLSKSDSELEAYIEKNGIYSKEQIIKLKKELPKIKIIAEEKKQQIERNESFKVKIQKFIIKHRPTIITVFFPLILLFFPYFLHPVR